MHGDHPPGKANQVAVAGPNMREYEAPATIRTTGLSAGPWCLANEILSEDPAAMQGEMLSVQLRRSSRAEGGNQVEATAS